MAGVYVHEVDGKAMQVTDALGTFKLSVSGEQDRTAILLMRKEYHDTVVYVGRDGASASVPLRKRATMERVEPLCIHERCQVADLGVARLLMPDRQLEQGTDLSFAEQAIGSISDPEVQKTNSTGGGQSIFVERSRRLFTRVERIEVGGCECREP